MFAVIEKESSWNADAVNYNDTCFGLMQISVVNFAWLEEELGLDDPKDPDSCNVVALFKLFASPEELAEMCERYRAGGYGYGHAKQALFEKMWNYFEPMRRRRAELAADPGYVEEVLRRNGERARSEAEKTLKRVRRAVGLR